MYISHHTLFIHSSVDKLGLFPLFGIMNAGAISIHVQVFALDLSQRPRSDVYRVFDGHTFLLLLGLYLQ